MSDQEPSSTMLTRPRYLWSIRFFLRQFAEEPEDGRNKVVVYIGPGSDGEKRSVLEEVFPSVAAHGAPHLITYNGGFDAFAAECLPLTDPDFN